jgi:phosphate/sulfate permease
MIYTFCISCALAVGGIMGFALVFGGSNAVVWYAKSDKFPYITGIAPIVISWFASPLLAALATLVMFLIIRTLVLRRPNSTKLAYYVSKIWQFNHLNTLQTCFLGRLRVSS